MNRLNQAVRVALVAAGLLAGVSAQAGPVTATLDVDTSKPGVAIPPAFYGLMTEEINYSYDGGLYAELIQNRSFNDNATSAVHWSATDGAKIEMIHDDPATPAMPVSLKVSLNAGKGGVANDGYWGIPVKPGTAYVATFYVKGGDGFAGPVTAAMVGDDGTEFAKAISAPVSDKWQKLTVQLKTADGISETSKAKFVLSAAGAGSVMFSVVSLFPPTYQNTPSGLRPDLMKLMSDMHPSFIRLPGGNYLEGDDFAGRYDWKKMIGPVDQRPGHMGPWRYRSSDGMGLPEMLLWCKQLNAEPVLAVFAGYTLRHDHVAAGPQLQPYVDEALQEIEYVTGPADSEWGKRRAADGFPEPFDLKYVEVGNEDWFDKSGSYDGRFAQFFDAIRAKYPKLKIIATARVKGRTPDVIDDHFYLAPARMAEKGTAYHTTPRNGSQIFLGEWASQSGKPTPNLKSGLADAAFLCGIEQDADLISMECYAPLLVNVNPGGSQWGTNLIGYDALHSFGSPSYYAQAMIGQNKGDVVLPTTLTVTKEPGSPPPAPAGSIGLGSWRTQVQYKDLTVTQDGKPLFDHDPTQSIEGWHAVNGDWKVQDGVIQPTNPDAKQGTWAYLGDPKWTNYTLSVKARKTGGAEGFLVEWHVLDNDTFHRWNIGGWGNHHTQCEVAAEGDHSAFGPVSDFTVKTDQWYDLRLEVDGDHVKCYADNKLITEATDEPQPEKSIFTAAEKISASNEIVLKVVNCGNDAIDTTLNLHGTGEILPDATATVLTGDPAGMNSINDPMKIAPKTEAINDASATMHQVFPPNSFTLLRLKTKPM